MVTSKIYASIDVIVAVILHCESFILVNDVLVFDYLGVLYLLFLLTRGPFFTI